ncbi:MAG: dephospho-CoA kinase [Bdellovibrionota bacterium]
MKTDISKKQIIGITGEIGSGKSYISNIIKKICDKKGILCHTLEFDHIGHEILGTLEAAYYKEIRKKLIETFGNSIRKDNDFIDRRELSKIVFKDKKALETLNKIMREPLIKRLNELIENLNGLILIIGALIIDFDLPWLCDNNIILVETSKELQQERLLERNLTKEEIEKRKDSQLSNKEKYNKMLKIIKKDGFGKIVNFKNNNASESEIEELLSEILKKEESRGREEREKKREKP